jgi:hypothetical protein
MLHVPTLGTLPPARYGKKIVGGLFAVTIELHQLSKLNLHFLMNPHSRLAHCLTQVAAFFIERPESNLIRAYISSNKPLQLSNPLVSCSLGVSGQTSW